MKANEAPEKIYITNYDIDALPKCEQLAERWLEASTQNTDIEYTRTDAFIEKACKWLEENAENYIWYSDYAENLGDDTCGMNDDFIEDFRKAMKGE